MQQDYAAYTMEDQVLWSHLFKRQQEATQELTYSLFSKSLSRLGMSETAIPDFEMLNNRIFSLTGWEIYAVPGLISNDFFFEQMYHRKFGATTWLRKKEQLDYLEEPDLFHDVFGHIPLLADHRVTEYLYRLAAVAEQCKYKEDIIEQIARLYWYTIEFGLVREQGQLKIYGAGIVSSVSETRFCLSREATLVPFELERILETPYIKDRFQSQYFVLDSMEELAEAATGLEKKLMPLS